MMFKGRKAYLFIVAVPPPFMGKFAFKVDRGWVKDLIRTLRR